MSSRLFRSFRAASLARRSLSSAVVMPLAVSAGLGFGLVLGAAAVTLSPAIGAVVASITTCSSTSACIGGANSGSGPGVAGISSSDGTGVAGTSSSGIGVTASSTSDTGVLASSTSGVGVIARSKSSWAILASNNTANLPTIEASQGGPGTAIFGGAGKGFGVLGQVGSGTGVSGTAGSGTGVSGTSTSGYGLKGNSTRLSGVIGNGVIGGEFYASQQDGVDGVTNSTLQNGDIPNGVAGYDFSSYNGNCDDIGDGQGGPGCSSGVFGYSTNSQAAYFTQATSDATPTVTIQGGLSSGMDQVLLAIYPSTDGGTSFFDDFGNLYLDGELEQNFACRNGCVKKRVRTYTARESEPTIEDVGRARLVAGRAYVALDSAFANVVDSRSDYAVLITPEGDSNGVFVAARSPRGFLVRENRGGRSSLAFSYRIVAKPFGKSEPRLPFVKRRVFNNAGAAALRARMERFRAASR